MITITPMAIVASCGADIAGFVIAGDCNSYLPNGHSQWFAFGVDEFLFIGGGIHIGVLFMFCTIQFFVVKLGVYLKRGRCLFATIGLYWIYQFLFSVSWNIVG